MSTFATVLMVALIVVICAGPPLVSWWLDRCKCRREVTIVMHPERALGFEPGQELLLQGGEFISKPLTVLRVDREKGEVTLG